MSPTCFQLHYSADETQVNYCVDGFFDLIYPFTSYTFPYSYLVTTSFQLQTYPRVAFPSVRIAKMPLSQPLWQAYFRTVTGGLYRTPEPVHRSLADLRLLAIPTSRFQIAEGDSY